MGIGESIALADEVIINNGSVEDLKKDVSNLLTDLKKKFNSEN